MCTANHETVPCLCKPHLCTRCIKCQPTRESRYLEVIDSPIRNDQRLQCAWSRVKVGNWKYQGNLPAMWCVEGITVREIKTTGESCWGGSVWVGVNQPITASGSCQNCPGAEMTGISNNLPDIYLQSCFKYVYSYSCITVKCFSLPLSGCKDWWDGIHLLTSTAGCVIVTYTLKQFIVNITY